MTLLLRPYSYVVYIVLTPCLYDKVLVVYFDIITYIYPQCAIYHACYGYLHFFIFIAPLPLSSILTYLTFIFIYVFYMFLIIEQK